MVNAYETVIVACNIMFVRISYFFSTVFVAVHFGSHSRLQNVYDCNPSQILVGATLHIEWPLLYTISGTVYGFHIFGGVSRWYSLYCYYCCCVKESSYTFGFYNKMLICTLKIYIFFCLFVCFLVRPNLTFIFVFCVCTLPTYLTYDSNL